MLDLRVIREQPETVERALIDKGGGELVKDIVARDAERRRLLSETEDLKALRNRASEAIGQAKRRGEDASAEQARMREVSDRIKALDAELKALDAAIDEILVQVPNLPHPSVPPGKSDGDNVEVRRWGTPRTFAFTPKPHEEIGAALGLLDLERATKIAKSRFAVLWGPLARVERALGLFMLDLHTREHGYTEVWVPHLVSGDTMLRTGQLPKFEEQLFRTLEADENRTLYLIPTAEVPLSALHGDETLPEASLPRRYTAFTPCYRREAGTYGKDMKGIFRQHQFDKVELVKIATAAQSYDELESMVREAAEVLKRLELPYRVVERCAVDVGFSSAKGYDIEVWLPGQDKYREISSCSNYADFGGRRVNIRYKPAGGKPEFCHTLNGSGLAVGRTLIAVLENYQEADGSVTIPTTCCSGPAGRVAPRPKPRAAARVLGAFLIVAAVSALVYCALVRLVDPYGWFGTGWLPPLAPKVRQDKIAAFRAASTRGAMQGLVLGSSRAIRLDPRVLEAASGLRFFNFTVDNARAEDDLALFRWVRAQGVAPRAVIIALEVETLHDDDDVNPLLR
ncbi:MAG: serine--tRNA ligase, partial [Candidatus Rokubacteria bacterium]|nr:serine--tRNA ligase [Candidatus Rokubacteria bacterium]